MGIKNLNRFFKDECKDSLSFVHLSALSGKKIAVDVSIYMYKYSTDGTLIENIYLMLSVFRHYNITPVFIFDGKPPAEKKDILKKRKDDKIEAQAEYDRLKRQLELNEYDEHDKQDVINTMDSLKSKFIYLDKHQIQLVKSLIRSHGATYYDAPGEADELCAMLVIKNKVWACLSEDMDMFVYGCTRVVRYLSLMNHTAVLYDLKGILDELGINQQQLREICVLSGTDYNTTDASTTLYNTLKLFKKFKKRAAAGEEFYNWLLANTSYIRDYETLRTVYEMFDLSSSNHENLKVFEDTNIANGRFSKDDVKSILKEDGFLFPVR